MSEAPRSLRRCPQLSACLDETDAAARCRRMLRSRSARRHLAVAADWAASAVRRASTRCRRRAGSAGRGSAFAYPSGWLCAVCEWRHGDVVDGELPPPRVDVVYYLRYADRVKIGTTSNPRQRVAAIWHDDLLAFERGDRRREQHRHAQFAEERFGARNGSSTPNALRPHRRRPRRRRAVGCLHQVGERGDCSARLNVRWSFIDPCAGTDSCAAWIACGDSCAGTVVRGRSGGRVHACGTIRSVG